MCGPTRRTLLRAGPATGALVALGTPPAAAAASPSATVRARRRFFGAANVASDGTVRPDRVVLSWFGCTSFAMAIDGHVVLLDAWVPRGEYSGVVPTTPAELAALRPGHLFIGHGHFDHAADAGPVASSAGAVVVGTHAHCRQAAAQAPGPVRTRPLGLAAPGDVDELRVGRVRVTAVRHVHSTATRPTGEDAPLLPVPDLTPVLTHPPTIQDALHELSHLPDEEGGCVLYRFTLGAFSLVVHDSAGPLVSDAPRAHEVLAQWPRTTIQVGAIQGFGQLTNGLRDPMQYVDALRPRVFVPSHHDNWAPPISSPSWTYEGRVRESLARIPQRRRPELRFLHDPRDYVRPARLTFPV